MAHGSRRSSGPPHHEGDVPEQGHHALNLCLWVRKPRCNRCTGEPEASRSVLLRENAAGCGSIQRRWPGIWTMPEGSRQNFRASPACRQLQGFARAPICRSCVMVTPRALPCIPQNCAKSGQSCNALLTSAQQQPAQRHQPGDEKHGWTDQTLLLHDALPCRAFPKASRRLRGEN